MNEILGVNPEAVAAEVAYRRSVLVGTRTSQPTAGGRWRRRRAPRND
jgi:hypothetical protein